MGSWPWRLGADKHPRSTFRGNCVAASRERPKVEEEKGDAALFLDPHEKRAASPFSVWKRSDIASSFVLRHLPGPVLKSATLVLIRVKKQAAEIPAEPKIMHITMI